MIPDVIELYLERSTTCDLNQLGYCLMTMFATHASKLHLDHTIPDLE